MALLARRLGYLGVGMAALVIPLISSMIDARLNPELRVAATKSAALVEEQQALPKAKIEARRMAGEPLPSVR